MSFPLNSFQEIFDRFFIVLGNLGKKLRNLCLLVEIGMHYSNCITVAAQDTQDDRHRIIDWKNGVTLTSL